MAFATSSARLPVRFDTRRLELAAIALALFLQSSAIFPLLATAGSGSLEDGARAILRLLALPVYLIAFVLLLLHPGAWIIALRRSLPLLLLTALPFVSIIWSIAPGLTFRRAVALLLSLALAYAIAIRTTPAQLLRLLVIVLGFCMALSLVLMVAAPGLAREDSAGFFPPYPPADVSESLGSSPCSSAQRERW